MDWYRRIRITGAGLVEVGRALDGVAPAGFGGRVAKRPLRRSRTEGSVARRRRRSARGRRGLGGGGLLLLILIIVGVLYVLPRLRAGGGGGEQPDEQQTFPTVPTPPGGAAGPLTAAPRPTPQEETYKGCPAGGDGTDPDLNTLKNRIDPVPSPAAVPFDSLLNL